MDRPADWLAPSDPKPRFRPDIEGLRGIAVLAVLLFHFDVPPFRGGYVGVDIFFVISGYLITANTRFELQQGRFSVASFYERRVRRILPAMLVVVLASSIVSLFVFLPNDLRVVGAGLTAAATFTSNILFYSIANDYFAADNLDLQPMLHSWSLSVEAQFYLVFPWLLLGLRWRRWPLDPVLLGLACLSFGISIWGVARVPTLAFYLLPARAWELLLGAMLAGRGPLPSDRWRHAASGAGLLLIGLSIVGYAKSTPFPGIAALPPCLGAALCIAAGTGPGGRSTAGLAAAPLVLAGRLSYSLYLWHWPLLVFAGYGRSMPLSLAGRLLLLLASAALALVSWRFVERPVLERRWLGGRAPMFKAACGATAVAALLGVVVDRAGRGDLPVTFLPQTVLTLANGQFDWIGGDCRPGDRLTTSQLPCRFGMPDLEPSVVAWGNSYMRMWVPTLDLDARRSGAAGVSLLRVRCLPLATPIYGQPADCPSFNAAAFDYIAQHPALHTVVLGANWFVAGNALTELGDTIGRLNALGRKVIVVLPPPVPTYAVPRTLAMAALRHQPPPAPIGRAAARAAQQDSIDIIMAFKPGYDFDIIDPAPVLCGADSCDVERDGHALYSDTDHISLYAARSLQGLFAPAFSR